MYVYYVMLNNIFVIVDLYYCIFFFCLLNIQFLQVYFVVQSMFLDNVRFVCFFFLKIVIYFDFIVFF